MKDPIVQMGEPLRVRPMDELIDALAKVVPNPVVVNDLILQFATDKGSRNMQVHEIYRAAAEFAHLAGLDGYRLRPPRRVLKVQVQEAVRLAMVRPKDRRRFRKLSILYDQF